MSTIYPISFFATEPLVEQKNTFLQKKKHAIFKEIENSDLTNWDISTLKKAFKYLESQKQNQSEIFKSWELKDDKTGNET